jgi:uncharacterized membrane protein YoaK (UPF0700 family)
MATFILVLHLLVILFFIVGFPIGLKLNHRGFRIFHGAALALVTLLMVLGIPCPLTVMEESSRDSSFEGSFIAFWLNRIIYLEWFDPVHVLILDLCFAALVFSSFIWHPLKRKRG